MIQIMSRQPIARYVQGLTRGKCVMLRLGLALFALSATVLAGLGLMVILIAPGWSSRPVTLVPYSVAMAIILSIPATWFAARLILDSSAEGIAK
jgi:hypothetical protein